ncbi:MAG: exodeoxyribonuclease VII small subunit [Nitrospirota bacterium]
MSKSRQRAYSQALSELERIVSEIEAEDIDVDALSEKVKRATTLISFCKERLRATEEEVGRILAEAEAQSEGRPEDGEERDAEELADPDDLDTGP